MPGRKPKYANDEERRLAANRRVYLADMPRKLETARRRHLFVVRTAKREGMWDLLTEEEKGWG